MPNSRSKSLNSMSSKQIATELLRRRLATESLIAFTEYTFERTAPHHRKIAEQLEPRQTDKSLTRRRYEAFQLASALSPWQHSVADDAALYFAGALKDCRQPRVAPVALYPPLGGIAIAAVELHGLVRDPYRHFRRK